MKDLSMLSPAEAEKIITSLQEQLAEAMKVLNDVGHVGVDFGYGKYKLTESTIEKARELVENYREAN